MTQEYYERHALDFFERTVGVELHDLYQRYLALLPYRPRILDAGCGSGRDSRALRLLGAEVTSLERSPALAALAARYCGLPVRIGDFNMIREEGCYDGVWASASLLHVPEDRLPETLCRLTRALRAGGAFYLSFKQGLGERQDGLRHFSDQTEESLRALIAVVPYLEPLDIWRSESRARPDGLPHWINAFCRRS